MKAARSAPAHHAPRIVRSPQWRETVHAYRLACRLWPGLVALPHFKCCPFGDVAPLTPMLLLRGRTR